MSASPSPSASPDTHAEPSSPRSQPGTPPESREPSPSPPHTGTPPESRDPSPSQSSPEPATNDPPAAILEPEVTTVTFDSTLNPELMAPVPKRSPRPERSPAAEPHLWTSTQPSPNDNALQRAAPLSEQPEVTNQESPRHQQTELEATANTGGRWAGKNSWESSGNWNPKPNKGGNRNMRSQKGGSWNNKTDRGGSWNQNSDKGGNWNNKSDKVGNWNNWKGGVAAKATSYSGKWATTRFRPDESAQPSATSAWSTRDTALPATSVPGQRDEPASSDQPPTSAWSTARGVVAPNKPVPAPAVSLVTSTTTRPRSQSPVPGFMVNGAFQPITTDQERLQLLHNLSTAADLIVKGRPGGLPAPSAIGLPVSAGNRRGERQWNQPRSKMSSSPPGKRVQVENRDGMVHRTIGHPAPSARGGPSRLPIARRVRTLSSIRGDVTQGEPGNQPPPPRLIPGAPKPSSKAVEIVDLTSPQSSRSLTTTGLQFDGDLATTVPTGYSPTVSLRSVSTFTRSGTRNPFSLPGTILGHGQHQRPFTFQPPAKKRTQVNRGPNDSTPVFMARMYAQQTAAMGSQLNEAHRQLNEEKIRKEEKRAAELKRRLKKSLRRRADALKATAELGGAPRQ